MKEYIEPEVEIIEYLLGDIIASSDIYGTEPLDPDVINDPNYEGIRIEGGGNEDPEDPFFR
jgi:hypothetical protein